VHGVIGIGRSLQWPEFDNFVELIRRIERVIDVKRTTLPPGMVKQEAVEFNGMGNNLEFAVGQKWVQVKGEHLQEPWRDQADIQQMYRNAAPPSNFGWDDTGAGGSQVEETDALGYSLSYPRARTLDYCTIPDTY